MFKEANFIVMKSLGIFAILCIFCFSIFGQRVTAPIFSFGGGFSSSNYTPFWLRANQFGAVPTEDNYINVGGSTYIEYRKGKKIDWGFGASGRLNLGEIKADLLVQEAYLKGKWGIFELSAGRKKYIQGLVDSTLSSGSYIYSGNALPMPKIEIVVNEYWHPKFLGQFWALRGTLFMDFLSKRGKMFPRFIYIKRSNHDKTRKTCKITRRNRNASDIFTHHIDIDL